MQGNAGIEAVKWRRGSDYHIVSDTGYSVSKSGPPDDIIYTAWAPRTGPYPNSILYTKNRKEAQAACEQHAKAVA